MKRSFVLALGLWAASPVVVLGQQNAQAQEQKNGLSFVLVAPDGTRVKNADVTIYFDGRNALSRGGGTVEARSDSQGEVRSSFSQAISEGTLSLTFWVPGVGSGYVEDARKSEFFPTPLSVSLKTGSNLTVRCVETLAGGSKPVGGVVIQAHRLDVDRNNTVNLTQMTSGPSFYATSRDGNGVVEFANIPMGSYIVSTGNDVAFGTAALAVQLDQKPVDLSLSLERRMTSTLALTVLNADGKPASNKRFFLATRYAPLSDETLLNQPRVSLAQAAQWSADLRFWPSGNPLPPREIQTDRNGNVLIYPVDQGRWKIALIRTEDRSNSDFLSSPVTVQLTGNGTTAATLRLKSDAKF